MSNSNATVQEKLRIDGKYILRLAGTLLGICLVVSLLLGVVNSFTAPIIDEIQRRKTAEAMAQVLPADEYLPIEIEAANVLSLYEARSGGASLGYVAEVTASGSQGVITLMVGVDAETLTVTGVSVTDHSETPGIGTKVVEESSVLERFTGMSHENGDITVNTGANRFDGVSGATISSRGVAAGVNTALAAVESVKADQESRDAE